MQPLARKPRAQPVCLRPRSALLRRATPEADCESCGHPISAHDGSNSIEQVSGRRTLEVSDPSFVRVVHLPPPPPRPGVVPTSRPTITLTGVSAFSSAHVPAVSASTPLMHVVSNSRVPLPQAAVAAAVRPSQGPLSRTAASSSSSSSSPTPSSSSSSSLSSSVLARPAPKLKPLPLTIGSNAGWQIHPTYASSIICGPHAFL